MPRYPKAPTRASIPDAAEVILLGGIEDLIRRLRRGDEIKDPTDLIGRLTARIEGLRDAAEVRVVEDD